MPYTIQDVIDLARKDLNDADAARYEDTDDLLRYANDGLDELFLLRPDVFIGSFVAAALTDGNARALGDTLLVDGRLRRALADYIVARAEMRDDEHVNSGRAVAMAGFFEKRLTT